MSQPVTSQPVTLTGQDIAEAQGVLRTLLEEVLIPTPVGPEEYVTLLVLAVRGPYASASELGDFLAGQRQLNLDQAAVGALLAGLESKGLISGSATDGGGPVQLTDAGAALQADLAATVAPATVKVFAGFDPDDLATTHRVLRALIDRAAVVRDEVAAQRLN